MRLLHVVPTYLPALRYGGPIRSVHALCRALAAQGHVADVFTTNVDGPGNSDVPLERAVDLEGVSVTYFRSPLLRRLYWSPAMERALRARIANYDLVHIHAIYLWPTSMAARVARKHDVPYVVSPRGMLVPELIRRKNRWVKEAWLRLLDRSNLEHAAAVHTTSAIEAHHVASFGWSLRRVVTVPHGVDDPPSSIGQAISPDISAAIAGAPPILAFGRISWEKGLDRLLEALPRVPNARLIIAGDDGGHAATLAEKARLFRVDKRVTIIARQIGGADKEALFAAAALFAMTSLSENFGLAAFEAMRRSLPVLTVPDVGMSEIVRDANAGAVVAPSPEGIAEGLQALLADRAASREMGQRGRERVVTEYGWDAIATRMSDVYRSAIEGKRRV
ncbi:MAG: glycosyltransferase [Enhydrobacter sp.]|nr:glycosyltransferase [Enhydrobacter sp.]